MGEVRDINEVRDEVNMVVGEKTKPRLKVVKLQVMPTFHLVEEDGTVIEEVNAQSPIIMYPGKFIELKQVVERLEKDANNNTLQIEQLVNRPLW